MGSKNFLLMLCVAGVFSTAASAQTWNAPSNIDTVIDDDTSLLQGDTFSDWKWVDPAGNLHSFPGTTVDQYLYWQSPDEGKIHARRHTVTNLVNVQASDGSPFYLNATGGSGVVNAVVKLYPHFRVMKVDYAPPGLKSYVDYTTTTITGSKTSSADTWIRSYYIGFTAQIFGNGGGITATSTETNTKTDSLTINLTSSWDAQFPGGPTSYDTKEDKNGEGINHDNDVITFLLNPIVILRTTDTVGSTSYGVDTADYFTASGNLDLAYLSVGQIKSYLANPNWTPDPTSPLARAWAGPGQSINASDLANMLKADPYAYDPTGINTSVNGLVSIGRYTAIGGQNIPYAPTGGPIQKWTAKYQKITANDQSDKVDIVAGIKVGAGWGISDWLGAHVIAGYSFTWSHLNLDSLSQENTEQALAWIVPASTLYTGPQSIVMYQDNLFGSIMFAPTPIH